MSGLDYYRRQLCWEQQEFQEKFKRHEKRTIQKTLGHRQWPVLLTIFGIRSAYFVSNYKSFDKATR